MSDSTDAPRTRTTRARLLVIGAIITLFVLMQITARVSWDEVFASGVGSAPPQGAGHGR